MVHCNLSILNIRLLLIFLLTSLSNISYGDLTSLEVNKDSIISVSQNSLSFQSVGSNGISYKSGLSCFNQEFDFKEGYLKVLKSEYHVGASISFPYIECLSLKKSLEKGDEKLILSWDQEKFDDFISTELDYLRVKIDLGE